tara:strand:- start:18 stop:422 length:405 start_codon:yes stop_codon:yes gene_type:complete
MTNNKNNYEIVQSFKSLLKKAEQLSHEKKTEKLLEKNKIVKTNLDVSKNLYFKEDIKNNRLGIKNIKRMPHYPFKKKIKLKENDYINYQNEMTIKITNILNKHISFWLMREMPKYVKIKLRKKIYSLLINLQKR